MPLPTMSLRAAPEHHAIIREVAAALRTRPELVAALRDLLAGQPDNAGRVPDDIAALRARLEAVERWIAERDRPQASATPGKGATRPATRPLPAAAPEQIDLEDLCGPPRQASVSETGEGAPAQSPHPRSSRTGADLAPVPGNPEKGEGGSGFGARVRQARVARGLSQKAFGRMVGVSGQAIALIEAGGGAKPETRARIEEVLGL